MAWSVWSARNVQHEARRGLFGGSLRRLQRVLFAGLVWACCMTGLAWAQEQSPRPFDIPAGPLASALNRFADETSLQLVYDTKLAEGLTTAGVSGTYTVEQALTVMLAGTGLGYRFANDQTVTLQPADRSSLVAPIVGAAAAGGVVAAAAADETANGTESSKPVKVPEVVVKEVRERDDDAKSYVAQEDSTAMRTDAPIRDVPQSVQVITRKVIEEQRAFRLTDSLQNISGIIGLDSSQGLFDNFLIRGFSANRSMFRNGLVDPMAAFTASDSYNLQRMEVLKGPASVLYGQGDPGGIINVVTKKPLPDPYYSANVTLGNFNFYRTELDATGPLNANKTLFYRLNVAGQKAGSFVDFINRDLVAVSPAVTWLMGSRTTLTVEADYLKRWNVDYPGVPVLGSVQPNINGPIVRNRFTGPGEYASDQRMMTRVGYDLTHQFNSNWSIRNAYRYTIAEESHFKNAFANTLLPDQRTLTDFFAPSQESVERQHFNNMITNVIGHFKFLQMDHRFLAGVELRQDKRNPSNFTLNSASNLDLFAPVYQDLGAPFFSIYSKQDTKMAGVYLQDMVSLLPNLKLLGGVRFDYVHQSINPTETTQETSDDTGVSPRVGLVYQPIEPVSLYASWTRGFLPNTPDSFNPNGQLFQPERSTQYEIGAKTFFFDNRVSTTLAWFHLTRDNLLTVDPVNPLFRVQTGEQRSQGVEFDMTATLINGWNVIASYAYTDAEVTQDNDPALVNRRLGNVPYNKVTLWSTYHFQDGALKGFGLGGGIYGYSSRNASIFGPGQVELPGYVKVNAALYYNHDMEPGNWLHAKQVNVALNFRNLLDQRYVEIADNTTTRVFFGEPRTVLATVGIKF